MDLKRKQIGEVLEIQTSDTVITYERLEEGLFKTHTLYDQSKGDRAGAPSREVTVTGPQVWQMILTASGSGQAASVCGTERTDVEYDCSQVFFIPPFSLIEFQFENLKVDYLGIMCNLPIPENAPKYPATFEVGKFNFPSSYNDVVNLFGAIQNLKSIERVNSPDDIAQKAREWIHENYESECSLGEIAKELKVAQSQLPKSFNKAFGISPVKYRSILRIQDSLRHLLFGGSGVTEAGFQVGFDDLSRFNKNFKNIMEAVPSQFIFRSKGP